MKLTFTKPFIRDYQSLPALIHAQADKQLELLLKDFRHPSLHTKKIKKEKGVWEGRVTKGLRFSFKIEKDTYILRRIGPHDRVLRKP
ncbi:hypothetical protein KKC52_08855 [bacterium]|nr:hypothetical protein [bacterium]